MISYIEQFQPYSSFLISLALGMLVGLQREWADTPAAGIRTFTFITLFGTACALVSEKSGPLFTAIGLSGIIIFAVIAHFQIMKSPKGAESSLVTGVTMLLMFIVGMMVKSKMYLPAAALTCLIAMILHIKLELHAIAGKFSGTELSSVMQFLLITIVILPLMPDKSFGPNDALNLYNIWLMVVLIVGISLFGYILNKVAGKKSGVVGGGLIGGLISSTATSFTYSRLAASHPSSSTFHGLVILIAWLIVYFRAYAEIMIVSPDVPILIPLIIMVLSTILMIFLVWKKNVSNGEEAAIKSDPIDLKTAVFFAVFYAILISIFSYFKDDVKNSALFAVTFVAGILDIDAITLSTARLVDRKILGPTEGVAYVFIGLLANTFFKGILCGVIGRKPLFKVIFFPWIGSIILQIGVIVWYWS